jgi:hypothetical protein
MLVPETPLASASDDEPLAGDREVGDAPDARGVGLAFIFIDDRPDGDSDDQIGPSLPRFVRCAARVAGLGRKVFPEAEIDQGREPGIGLEGDVAPFPPIAAGRPPFGDVLLAAPRDDAVPTLSGGDGYRDFVNKLRLVSP